MPHPESLGHFMKEILVAPHEFVTLNVSGIQIDVAKQFLLKYPGSYLHALFTDETLLKKPVIHIQRPFDAFSEMLTFLQTGQEPKVRKIPFFFFSSSKTFCSRKGNSFFGAFLAKIFPIILRKNFQGNSPLAKKILF